MKFNFALFSFALLLNACTPQIDLASNATADVAKCPTQKEPMRLITSKDFNFYDRFDYHIRNIVSDGDTVKFQAQKYDFVFCRSNGSWTIQPGTLPSSLLPKDYAEVEKDLINPPLKNIEFQGKKYQYRVLMSPNPFKQPSVNAEAVIFEVVSPDGKTTKRQTLYTLKDLQQGNVGGSLGVPRVTAAIIHGDRLWWSVASEQGEGASGIATIISYHPQANKLTLIQPDKLKGQQITDLAITGDSTNPTFWLGTQLSGEGNAYLPGMGLVAYSPDPQNPNLGSVKSYNVHNSPIVGAIPDKLKLEKDTLWVGTGNGVCQVKWQTADNSDSWSCGRFAVMTKLPTEGLSLYSTSIDKTPAAKLSPASSGENIEVLWFSPVNSKTRKGRYEVRYPQGFTVTLKDQGAELLPSDFVQIRSNLAGEQLPFYWPGGNWHWNGDRLVRGFDEVGLNLVGGGPRGIGSQNFTDDGLINSNAIRGDLDLLNLTKKSTTVRYYSGWVDEAKINPYLKVVPQERPKNPQPNPLKSVADNLL
jgi:hypothetical protein